MRERLEDEVREEWREQEGAQQPRALRGESQGDSETERSQPGNGTGPFSFTWQAAATLFLLLSDLSPQKAFCWFCQATHVHFFCLHTLAFALLSPEVTPPSPRGGLPLHLQNHP